jgi:hypothetical protein
MLQRSHSKYLVLGLQGKSKEILKKYPCIGNATGIERGYENSKV